MLRYTRQNAPRVYYHSIVKNVLHERPINSYKSKVLLFWLLNAYVIRVRNIIRKFYRNMNCNTSSGIQIVNNQPIKCRKITNKGTGGARDEFQAL
jgi:hypothetical protein